MSIFTEEAEKRMTAIAKGLRRALGAVVRAEYCGVMKGLSGETLELWTLIDAIPGHPEGSTVCRETIEEAGFRIEGRKDD